MENITAKPTRRDLQSEQEIRGRLVDLGRRAGMSEGQIALALRVGSVRHDGDRRQGDLLRHADIERVIAIFLEELAGVSWPPVDIAWLRSRAKGRQFAWPRMICATLIRQHVAGASFPVIARALGLTDHTTVMHANDRAPDILAREPELATAAARATDRISAESRG